MIGVFEHGDVVHLNFDPSHRHEPAGWHYAVVISPFRVNCMCALTLVAPITSTDNGYPLHVRIADGNEVHGFVQVEGLRSLDLGWHAQQGCLKTAGSLDDDTMAKVMGRVASFTGLEEANRY